MDNELNDTDRNLHFERRTHPVPKRENGPGAVTGRPVQAPETSDTHTHYYYYYSPRSVGGGAILLAAAQQLRGRGRSTGNIRPR